MSVCEEKTKCKIPEELAIAPVRVDVARHAGDADAGLAEVEVERVPLERGEAGSVAAYVFCLGELGVDVLGEQVVHGLDLGEESRAIVLIIQRQVSEDNNKISNADK